MSEGRLGKALGAGGRRFLIVGLPRSGTTYLMTLLNAHRRIYCSGEQFNPRAIVGIRKNDDDLEMLAQRDNQPLRFMEAFFARNESRKVDRVGFKYMIGHHIRVLKHLENDPSLTLIYVHRRNKLAQVSSLVKAIQTKRWAQHRPDDHIEQKIRLDPRGLYQRWHEYATFDHLFEHWLAARPNPKITLEYRDMFQPGFNAQICDFLGLAQDKRMKSPLVKQGTNRILDRFENPEPIRAYVERLGFGHWLEDEIKSPEPAQSRF